MRREDGASPLTEMYATLDFQSARATGSSRWWFTFAFEGPPHGRKYHSVGGRQARASQRTKSLGCEAGPD